MPKPGCSILLLTGVLALAACGGAALPTATPVPVLPTTVPVASVSATIPLATPTATALVRVTTSPTTLVSVSPTLAAGLVGATIAASAATPAPGFSPPTRSASPVAVVPTLGPPPTPAATLPPPTATLAPARSYPASLHIVTEITYLLDGEAVTVGLPQALNNNPRVLTLVRDYLQAYHVADRAFATGNEALLGQVLAGPMLERELGGLRDDQSKGQVAQFGRTGRVLAIYTISDDKAGIYDAFTKTDTILDARTGQVRQMGEPHQVSILAALQLSDGIWRIYDARTFRD